MWSVECHFQLTTPAAGVHDWHVVKCSFLDTFPPCWSLTGRDFKGYPSAACAVYMLEWKRFSLFATLATSFVHPSYNDL